MQQNGDLDDILVVSLEQAVAAPYASCKLADAGARVIKIERKEGDFARFYDADVGGQSSYFVWLNRGKESLSLDLKQAEDLALLRRLIKKADIFIQNLAPGATERLGIASHILRQQNEKLITCDISGYGSTGDLRDMKAYDLLVQAETGLSLITGGQNEAGRVGVSVCDIAAGMTAHQALLQALYGRTKTGRGRGIEVSLFHALSDWMNVPYLQNTYGEKEIKRAGLHHISIAPYGAYHCRDQQQILISIQNEREWRRLCDEILGDSAIADDPRFESNIARVKHRQALDKIINDVFSAYQIDTLSAKLYQAKIAFGRLNHMTDLAHHKQSEFITVTTSDGAFRLLAPGAKIIGQDHQGGSVPDIGAHNKAIWDEFS
ncbi:MAG: CaiB/BaiF CoA transferase family protein [Candidatus Puniceispirillaceae bacterium]